MRKLLTVFSMVVVLSACGQSKVINGKEYKPYGLLNSEQRKDEAIQYDIITGNVILGVIFSETFLVPGYFICFEIWEPIGPKKAPPKKVSA